MNMDTEISKRKPEKQPFTSETLSASVEKHKSYMSNRNTKSQPLVSNQSSIVQTVITKKSTGTLI
eukprot:UN32545